MYHNFAYRAPMITMVFGGERTKIGDGRRRTALLVRGIMEWNH